MSGRKRWTVMGLKVELDKLKKQYHTLLQYSEDNDIVMQARLNKLSECIDIVQKDLEICSSSFKRVYILSIGTAILMFVTLLIVVL